MSLSKEELVRYVKIQRKKLKDRDDEIAKLKVALRGAGEGGGVEAKSGQDHGLLQEELRKKTKENEELSSQLELARKKGMPNNSSDAVEEELRKKSEENEGLLEKMRELLRRYKILQKKFNAVEKGGAEQTSGAENRIAQAEETIRKKSAIIAAAEVQIDNLQQRVKDLKEKLQEAETISQTRDASLKELPGRIGSAEAGAAAAAKVQIDNLQQRVKDLKEKLQEAESISETREAALKELQGRTDSAEAGASEQENLRKKLKSAESTMQAKEIKIKGLEARVKSIETSIKDSEGAASDAAAEKERHIDGLARQGKEAALKIKKLKMLLAKSREQLKKESKTAAAPTGFSPSSIIARVGVPGGDVYCLVDRAEAPTWETEDRVLSWLETSERKVLPPLVTEEAEMEAKRIEASLLDLQQELSEYKKKAQVALQRAGEDANVRARKKMQRMEVEAKHCQDDLAKATRRCDDLLSKIENGRRERTELEVQVRKLEAEAKAMGRMKAGRAALEKKLESASAALADAVGARGDLENECRLLREERQKLESSLTELRAREENTEKEARDKRSIIKQLKVMLEDARAEAMKAKAELRVTQERPSASERAVPNLSSTPPLQSAAVEKQEAEAPVSKASTEVPKSPPRRGTSYELAAASQSSSILFAKQFEVLRSDHDREKLRLMGEVRVLKNELSDSESALRLMKNQLAHVKTLLRDADRKDALVRDHPKGLASTRGEQSSEDEVGGKLIYLKNVVHKYISSQDPTERETLLPVLAALLHFDQSEVNLVKDAIHASFLRIQTQGMGDVVTWGKEVFGFK